MGFFFHVFLAQFICPICFVSFLFWVIGFLICHSVWGTPLGLILLLRWLFIILNLAFSRKSLFVYRCLFLKKNYFIFPFFSFCLPSQLWCVFILCVFNYKLPPTVLFLWFLHHFLLFSTTYFLFPQLTGLLNCPSIDDIFGSRVLFLFSFFTLFNSTQFGNALTWNGRTSWFFHCFYSLLFESPSLNLLTLFLD